MSNLFDYENADQPEVKRDRMVRITTEDGERRVVGFIGRDVGRGEPEIAYVSKRERNKHYFFKGGGYPIAAKALEKCRGHNVTEIFIVEVDSGNVYEFSVADYIHGSIVKEDGFEEQLCVPLEKYRRMWESAGAEAILSEDAQ